MSGPHEHARARSDAGQNPVLPIGSLVALGLLALAARLAYLLVGQRAGLFSDLGPDARFHVEAALALRAGTPASAAPYLLSPLYPYFLALFPSLDDPATTGLAVRVVQALFGAATCALTARLASRLGGRRAGILAGVVVALYGPLIHLDTALDVAPLVGFCLILATLLLASPTPAPGRWLAAGVALGAAVAAHPATLAIVVVLALGAALRDSQWKRALVGFARAAALLVGAGLVVAPFSIRNVRAGGEPLLLSASAGLSFWIGNHARASGAFAPPPGYDPEDPVGRELARGRSGRDLSYVEASGWWAERTWADIRAEPARWFRTAGTKLLLLLHPRELPQLGAGFERYRERAWPLRFPLDARVLLILACCALPLARFGREQRTPLTRPLLVAITYLATVALFYVSGRLRMPVMPPVIALAACATCAALGLARARRLGPLTAVVVAFSFTLAGTAWMFRAASPWSVASASDVELRQSARDLTGEGRHDEAVLLLRRALDQRESEPTRLELAEALRSAGQPDEALSQYRHVLATNPLSAVALLESGVLSAERAPGATPAERTRILRESEALFRKVTQLQPRFAKAHFHLGVVLLEQRRFDEAAASLEAALQTGARGAGWRAEAEEALIAALRQGARADQPDPTDD